MLTLKCIDIFVHVLVFLCCWDLSGERYTDSKQHVCGLSEAWRGFGSGWWLPVLGGIRATPPICTRLWCAVKGFDSAHSTWSSSSSCLWSSSPCPVPLWPSLRPSRYVGIKPVSVLSAQRHDSAVFFSSGPLKDERERWPQPGQITQTLLQWIKPLLFYILPVLGWLRYETLTWTTGSLLITETSAPQFWFN